MKHTNMLHSTLLHDLDLLWSGPRNWHSGSVCGLRGSTVSCKEVLLPAEQPYLDEYMHGK